MNKNHTVLFVACLLICAWVLLFPTTQAASSSPLLGFTLTPTAPIATSIRLTDTPAPTTVIVTNTPVSTSVGPTNTPSTPTATPGKNVPTLPPPPPQPGVLIPVTGANHSATAGSSLLITAGLIVAAIGLAFLGQSRRKK